MYNQPKGKEKFEIGDVLKLSDEQIIAERSQKDPLMENSSSLNLYECCIFFCNLIITHYVKFSLSSHSPFFLG